MNLIEAAKAVIPDLEALEANKRALGKPNAADLILAKLNDLKVALTEEPEVKKTKKPVKPPKKC